MIGVISAHILILTDLDAFIEGDKLNSNSTQQWENNKGSHSSSDAR